MYAGTGISTDSARRKKSKSMARWTARQTRRIFKASPMPELAYPQWEPRLGVTVQRTAIPALTQLIMPTSVSKS